MTAFIDVVDRGEVFSFIGIVSTSLRLMNLALRLFQVENAYSEVCMYCKHYLCKDSIWMYFVVFPAHCWTRLKAHFVIHSLIPQFFCKKSWDFCTSSCLYKPGCLILYVKQILFLWLLLWSWMVSQITIGVTPLILDKSVGNTFGGNVMNNCDRKNSERVVIRKIDRLTHKQIYRHTGIQAHRQTDRQWKGISNNLKDLEYKQVKCTN